MRFRFIDSNGKERTANGLASLLELTKQGTLNEDTLVFDETEGRWRKAREIDYLIPPAESQSKPALQSEGEPPSLNTTTGRPLAPDSFITDLAEDEQEGALETVATSAAQSVTDAADARPDGPPPLDLPSLPEPQHSGWRRMTAWLRDEANCAKVAFVFIGLCAVMFWMLIANSAEADAAENFGELLGRLLGYSIVMFFLLRRWGKGQAFLIVAVSLFCFFGYVVQSQILGSSARKSKVMASFVSDIQHHTQAYSNELLRLKLDTLFEMLDGKQAHEQSDLVQMQSNVAMAETENAEFRSYFVNRIAQARREVANVDPAAEPEFMTGIGKSFPQVQQAYADQTQYFEELDALLTFVLERRGSFEITPAGIRFHNAGDLAEYNRRVDRINDLSASIKAIQLKFQGDTAKK